MYSLLFVCVFTSHVWSHRELTAGGEIIRFDKILLFGQINIYYLFAVVIFIIVFFIKLGPNNDRNVLGNRNYLKNIFWIYFTVINILLYITVYIKDIPFDDLGIGRIILFFIYLITTFYVQDIFLKNKDYKQLMSILIVLEVIILLRGCYSIIKYLLGFGHQDALVEGTRLAYESDFADFFVLLFIIALTGLLFGPYNSRKVRLLHQVSLFTSSFIAIGSFRRYFWIEILIASFIIMSCHYRFNKVPISKKTIFLSFFIIVIFSSVIFGGDKIKNSYYVGRLLSSLSLLDAKKYSSQYGTDTGHTEELKDGWFNVKHNWLLGITPAGDQLMIRFKTAEWESGNAHVHNAYIQIWLVYGLLGLILYLILYWKSTFLGYELFIDKGLPFGLILFTFCCAQVVKNFVWNTVIINTNITIVYIFIISLGIRMKQISKELK